MTGIVRAPRAHTHDLTPRAAIRDRRLSYRARGVLERLLSNADGFSMTSTDLAREGKEGRGAVLTALRELRAVGYVRTTRRQLPNGRFVTETIVYECATEVQFSDSGSPDSGFPDAKSSKSFPTEKKKQQEDDQHAAAAPSDTARNTARNDDGGRQFERRPSGIECWWPKDQAAAVAVEAEYPSAEISAAVAVVRERKKSPTPGSVVHEIRRQRRARAASAASVAAPTVTYDPAAAFRGELAAISHQAEVDTP